MTIEVKAAITPKVASQLKGLDSAGKVTPEVVRSFLENDYKHTNCCPVVQRALDRIHNISVFSTRTQISFSNSGKLPVPENILQIISRDVKEKFFKSNRTYSVQCINLKK